MRILGIDPGSRRTGWGLVSHAGNRSEYLDSGALKLGDEAPLAERLLRLSREMEGLLAKYRPDHCAVERIFTGKNARSALVLGHARGVILCAMAREGVALHEYTPTEIKHAIVGRGRATKSQIQLMVNALLKHNGALQEDEADALAVALTHAAFSGVAGKLA
jgi:crossover junction endodeoxyribonuclease RuvC